MFFLRRFFFLLRCFIYHYLFMESKKLYLKRVMQAILFRLINRIHLWKLIQENFLGLVQGCFALACASRLQKTFMFNLFIGYQINSN